MTIFVDTMAHADVLDFEVAPTAPTHVHEEVEASSERRKRKRSTKVIVARPTVDNVMSSVVVEDSQELELLNKNNVSNVMSLR